MLKMTPSMLIPLTADAQLKGKKLLLVEDNPMSAFAVQKVLTAWGIEVWQAKDGNEAIAQAKKREYDFILMDIHMPGLNGYEATEYIRTQANPNNHKPILALTIDITAMEEERFVSYFDAFLWKPLEVKTLYEALMKCLLS